MFGSTGVSSRPRVRSCSPGAPSDLLPSRSRTRRPGGSATSSTTCRPAWPISGTTTFRSDLIRSTRRRIGCGVLQQGPVQHQLRARIGDDRLPADDVRGHARGDRAGDRPELRGRYWADREADRRSSRCRRSRRTCPNPPTADCAPVDRSTASPRSSCSTSATQEWKRLPHLSAGPRYAVADPGALRRPDNRDGADPLRQRPDGQRRLQRRHRRSAGPSNDRDRRDPRAGQALRQDARRGRPRPGRRAGRDLRPGRSERRRQDDHAADARHAAAAVRGHARRSTAGPSPGTPTRSAASSASCRTCSGSTTT